MNAVAVLALGCAFLVAPAAAPERRRLAALGSAGRVAETVRRRRKRAAPEWPSLSPRIVAALAAAGTVFASITWGPALGVAAGAAISVAGGLAVAARSRSRLRVRRRGLLTALRLLAADIAAGSRAGPALAAAADASPPHAAAFGAAADAAEHGEDAAAQFEAGGQHDLSPLAHAWRVAESSGAPLAEVLERLAADFAAAEAQDRAVASALAGPRSSALLVAVLPAIGLAMGAAMGAAPLATLLHTAGGRLLACSGVCLDALGVAWMHWLTRRAEA
jgi:tight adherence protein B